MKDKEKIFNDINYDTIEIKADEIKEAINELIQTAAENEVPINFKFYGCSFSFAKESTADSKYINGSDVYNSMPNKFEE